MHPDYLSLVAECQFVTDNLTPELFYKFYSGLLPKQKFFTKYISSKSENDKYYTAIVDFFTENLRMDVREAEMMVDTLSKTPSGVLDIRQTIKDHGFTNEEIKKQFNL